MVLVTSFAPPNPALSAAIIPLVTEARDFSFTHPGGIWLSVTDTKMFLMGASAALLVWLML